MDIVGLKSAFEAILCNCPKREFLKNDPLIFPRMFFEGGRCRVEVEAIALFSAMIAYGKVSLFMDKIRSILDSCQNEFLKLALGKIEISKWPSYRFSTSEDIKNFVRAIGRMIANKKGVWEVFKVGWEKTYTIVSGIVQLRKELLNALAEMQVPITRGLLHFLPDPEKGGACKRWNMFIRWMVRPNDGIDLGLWPEIPTSELIIPLDRHISQIARHLGLTTRTNADWKTSVIITNALKKLDPNDPIRYDFVLCHLGISGTCSHGKKTESCAKCLLKPHCKT